MDVPTTPASHATHDELLLAAFAAGDDLAPADAARAKALEVDCPSCTALVVDIRDLMAATATLPAPARRRDFRLTDADAARLRPAGWRGLVAAFGDARLAFTRPLAAGLVTAGMAGLLLAITPGILAPAGGSASFMTVETPLAAIGPAEMPVPNAIDGAVSPAPEVGGLPAGAGAPAASPGASGTADTALPPDDGAAVQVGGPEATSADRTSADASPAPKARDAALAAGSEPGAPEASTLEASPEASAGGSGTPVSWITIVAATLLGLGALLFALRAAGRRIVAG